MYQEEKDYLSEDAAGYTDEPTLKNEEGTYRLTQNQLVAEEPLTGDRTFREDDLPHHTKAEGPDPAFFEKQKKKKKGGFWKILALVAVSLCSGLLGALLMSGHISNRISAEVTKELTEHLEETGTTVLYRSVNTALPAEGSSINVSAVSELAADSVVEVFTEIVSNSFYSLFGYYTGENVRQGAGSGVILSENGYILTCYHVVEDASAISVSLHNGEIYEAVLVGGDAEEDIAVLKIEATDLTPAVIGNSSDLTVGSPVVAIGNPLGKLGGTVTSGYISALDRELTVEGHTYTLLQTDAAINSGNSGGGLFNQRGELIGLVNAKAASLGVEGLGFAIPIESIEDYIEDIINYGYITSKVTLGVTLLDIDNERTAMSYRVDEMGVYILYVHDDSNASYAGLRSGDRILTIDGEEVKSAQQIIDYLATKSTGDVIELEISRDGEYKHFSITLYGVLPEEEKGKITAMPAAY